eukprot:9466731-Pyramimonas_sp.AAC.3
MHPFSAHTQQSVPTDRGSPFDRTYACIRRSTREETIGAAPILVDVGIPSLLERIVGYSCAKLSGPTGFDDVHAFVLSNRSVPPGPAHIVSERLLARAFARLNPIR